MKFIRRIYLLLLIIFGILCLAMSEIERVSNQHFLTRVGKMNLNDFWFIFMCLIVLGLVSLIICFWRKANRKLYKVLLIFSWIGIIVVMIVGSLNWLFYHVCTSWYEFYSPSNKHSLVVSESTFLLLSNISFYERTSPIFVRKLKADLSPNNGFAAISQGAYKISWDKDILTLSIDMNEKGMWSGLKLNMSDKGKVLKKFSEYPNGKPKHLDTQADKIKKDGLSSILDEDAKHRELNQKIIDGLKAVALKTEYKIKGNLEITYTAKGTPRLIVSSNPNLETYILYDRDSFNRKCALYVLYQLKNNGEESLSPEILEMYAYEYSSGKVIKANRHAWSDVGTDEYREATGE